MWLQQRLWLLTFHKTAKVKTTALPEWQGGQTYAIFEKDQEIARLKQLLKESGK